MTYGHDIWCSANGLTKYAGYFGFDALAPAPLAQSDTFRDACSYTCTFTKVTPLGTWYHDATTKDCAGAKALYTADTGNDPCLHTITELKTHFAGRSTPRTFLAPIGYSSSRLFRDVCGDVCIPKP